MRPVVILHPREPNLDIFIRYARHLKASVRHLTVKDSRLFINERYILSDGSSLLFFAFFNGAKGWMLRSKQWSSQLGHY